MVASHGASICLSFIRGQVARLSRVKMWFWKRQGDESPTEKEGAGNEAHGGESAHLWGESSSPSRSGPSGIAWEAEAMTGGRPPAWGCTHKALGAERRTGLTPAQTCRCAARPPRWSPGKTLRLQQTTQNAGERCADHLPAGLSGARLSSLPCRKPQWSEQILTAPRKILREPAKMVWLNG